MPSRNASPNEMPLIASGCISPGLRYAAPASLCAFASLNRFRPVRARTSTVMTTPHVISSPALMICTHVVASMPPKIT